MITYAEMFRIFGTSFMLIGAPLLLILSLLVR